MSQNQQSLEEKKRAALEYHSMGRPGKIEVVSTKPCITANDLSKAYTPGVAAPCLEIAENQELAYKYTSKGNLVAVISNGTAVLGLGNIGPLAGKPVMEGKGILFKRFADIDVFDIEVDDLTVDGVVKTCKAIAPTFGGINLEDIKAPECFEIERQLVEALDIPVFHDDQHGTAIIGGAAFINALEITGRKIETTKIVFSGAGAAAIASARLFVDLGARKENILLVDSKGVVYEGRTDGMNQYKQEFSAHTSKRTLTDAMNGADAFIGVSVKGLLKPEMVVTMAPNPIIFAMANPDPEIYPEEVFAVRKDAIMATGRSDFPNQVNNVLGFPFIFRGALDTRARKINIEMKRAAVKALAELAKEEVPEEVKMAYGGKNFSFGREYLIPKPFDRRVLTRVAPAVAKAAMDSGVARKPITDFYEYAQSLEERMGQSAAFSKTMRDHLTGIVEKKGRQLKVVFAEGQNTRILQCVSILNEDNRISPVLLGNPEQIHKKMDALGLPHLKGVSIIDPEESEHYESFALEFYKERQRKGISKTHAQNLMKHANYYGSMLVRHGLADALITGVTQTYPECFRPIMQVLGTENKAKASGIYILIFRNRTIFLTDCTAQVTPNAQDIADNALSAANLYRQLMKKEPRVAFLSFSSFGSNMHPDAQKMKNAMEIAKEIDPKLICDGEIQADVAVSKMLIDKYYDFSKLDQPANILVFPDLNSANISYKLLTQLAETTAIGPILVPLKHGVNIIQRTAPVNEIVNMAMLTAIMSQKEVR